MKKLSVEEINELKMTALEEADPDRLVNPVTKKWGISMINFGLKPGSIIWDDPDYETIFQDGETDGWHNKSCELIVLKNKKKGELYVMISKRLPLLYADKILQRIMQKNKG